MSSGAALPFNISAKSICGYHQKSYMIDRFFSSVYLINYEFLCRVADTNALLDWTAEALFGILISKRIPSHGWTADGLVGLDLALGMIGWSIGNDPWFIRCNQRLIWGIFSTYRQTGIVMSPEGSCFGWDLIVDEIKVSCLTVVPSLGEVGGPVLPAYSCLDLKIADHLSQSCGLSLYCSIALYVCPYWHTSLDLAIIKVFWVQATIKIGEV